MLWPILAVVMTAAAVLGWVVAACRGADLRQCEAELARFKRQRGAAEAGAFARGAVAALGDSQVQE